MGKTRADKIGRNRRTPQKAQKKGFTTSPDPKDLRPTADTSRLLGSLLEGSDRAAQSLRVLGEPTAI